MFMMEFLAQQERNFKHKQRIRKAKRLAQSFVTASIYLCSGAVVYNVSALIIGYYTR